MPLLGLLFVVGLFVASAPGSDSGVQGCTLTKGSSHGVPANYVPWLLRAAAKYKLGPRGFSIVAAIHYVESDFGRSPLPGVAPGTQNFAGAEGPGQFLVPSWAAYGVDADGDGDKDVYSVPDSVFGTANLLHAAGAPGDWPGAIFTYNHAQWYVEEVEAKAAKIGGGGEVVCASGAAALPGGNADLRRVETLNAPLRLQADPLSILGRRRRPGGSRLADLARRGLGAADLQPARCRRSGDRPPNARRRHRRRSGPSGGQGLGRDRPPGGRDSGLA